MAFKHINANEQITDSSIGTSLIADGAITSAKLAFNAITSSNFFVDSNIDFNNFQALDFRIENLNFFPIAGNPGRLIWRTDLQDIFVDSDFTLDILQITNLPLHIGLIADATHMSVSSTTGLSVGDALIQGGFPFSTCTILSTIDTTHLVVASTAGINPSNVLVQAGATSVVTAIIDATHLTVTNTNGFQPGTATVSTPFVTAIIQSITDSTHIVVDSTAGFIGQAVVSADFGIVTVTDGTHLVVDNSSAMTVGDVINQGLASTVITSVVDLTHITVNDTTGFSVGIATVLAPIDVLAIPDSTHLVVSDTSGFGPGDSITQGLASTTITAVPDSTHLVVVDTNGFALNAAKDSTITVDSTAHASVGQYLSQHFVNTVVVVVADATHLAVADATGFVLGPAFTGNWVAINEGANVTSIHADNNPLLHGDIQFLSGTNAHLPQLGQTITVNVPAAGATGQLQFNLDAQNDFGADANLFWDNVNKRLGIGNAAPSVTLEVTGDVHIVNPTAPNDLTFQSDNDSLIHFKSANGATEFANMDFTVSGIQINHFSGGIALQGGPGAAYTWRFNPDSTMSTPGALYVNQLSGSSTLDVAGTGHFTNDVTVDTKVNVDDVTSRTGNLSLKSLTSGNISVDLLDGSGGIGAANVTVQGNKLATFTRLGGGIGYLEISSFPSEPAGVQLFDNGIATAFGDNQNNAIELDASTAGVVQIDLSTATKFWFMNVSESTGSFVLTDSTASKTWTFDSTGSLTTPIGLTLTSTTNSSLDCPTIHVTHSSPTVNAMLRYVPNYQLWNFEDATDGYLADIESTGDMLLAADFNSDANPSGTASPFIYLTSAHQTQNGSAGSIGLYPNSALTSSGVAISKTYYASPDASALLDVQSTAQGFLAPRMTTVQRDAIVSPAVGLLIYNTDSNLFNFWTGSSWLPVGSPVGNVGDVQFNAGGGLFGANPNFYWDITNARLGIGNAAPATTLDVTGTGHFSSDVTIDTQEFITNTSGNATLTLTSSAANASLLVFKADQESDIQFFDSTGSTILGKIEVDGPSGSQGTMFIQSRGTIPTGQIILSTQDSAYQWKFDNVGDLTTPRNTLLSNNNKVIFGDNNGYNISYNTDRGGLSFHRNTDSSLQVFLGAPGLLEIDANTGLDGTGPYLPNVVLGTGISLAVDVAQSVNIGTSAAPSPEASAIVQIASTTQGFLQPKMTTTQRDAIASPAVGLQIYNTTTNAIEVWDGTEWNSFGQHIVLPNVNASIALGGATPLVVPSVDVSTNGAVISPEFLIWKSGSSGTSNTDRAGDLLGESDGTIDLYTLSGKPLRLEFPGVIIDDSNSFTDPDASAILDLKSTTRGLLPPRMTTTQKNAIASPATGLMVYDTTLNNLQEYNGTMWRNVAPLFQQDIFNVSGPGNVFTLTFTPLTNSQHVFYNGLALAPGVTEDYTISGNVVTLNAGIVLTNGDKILVTYSY